MSNKLTKRAFIMALPVSTPAAEVIAKAEEAGMRLTAHQVHNTRWADRARGKRAVAENRPTTRRLPTTSTHQQQELELRACIAEVGLVRVAEIVKQIDAAFA